MEEGRSSFISLFRCGDFTNKFSAFSFVFHDEDVPLLFSPSPFEVFEDDPDEDRTQVSPVDETFIIDWD